MYDFGSIVLVPFPFTDLTSAKVRPALIVSKENERGDDVVLCFISSRADRVPRHTVSLEPNEETGLKVRSIVRFDKIATLEKRVILGELGRMEREVLQKHRTVFFGVFGF